MKNISKIKLNLLTEKLYFEGLCNQLYEDISKFGESLEDIKLLIESDGGKNNVNSFIEEIITELKIAPKFIFTFGTGIGAFHGPVTRLLEGSGFQFTEKEIVLLIMTSIAILLNESDAETLKDEVEKKGLSNTLDKVKNFILQTKNLLDSIAKKATGVGYSLTDILGFTFLLVPTMRFIEKLISKEGVGINEVDYLFKGLVLASLTYTVKTILKRINRRFKS